MSEPLLRTIGLALVHSLWQGALIVIVLATMLAFMTHASARHRYLLLVTGLVLHVAAPVATVTWLLRAPVRATLASPFVSISTPRPALSREAVSPTPLGGERASTSRVESLRTALTPEAIRLRLDALLPFVVALWLVGVVVGTARLFGAWLLLRRFIARSTVASPALQARVRALAQRVGGVRHARILTTSALRGPFTTGSFRPVIVLPLSMLTGLDQASIDAIIVHELAHVRRWDYAITLLQAAAMTVLFHHPASWWLDRRIRVEREYCCDDLVVATSHDRVAYARALANLETLAGSAPALALSALDGSLVDRVERLLGVRRAPQASAWVPALALLAVLFATPVVDASPALHSSVASAPLASRWESALQEARQKREEVVIGWRIRSAHSDDTEVISSTDGSSDERGDPVAQLAAATGAEARGVALLFTWSGADDALHAVRLRSMSGSAALRGRRILWLGSADDSSSITLIERIMHAAPTRLRSELGAAITLHDDVRYVVAAVARVVDSDSGSVRAETLAWLGRQHASAPARALIARGVTDPSPHVRDEALTVMAGRPGSAAELRDLLRTSPYDDVRQEIVQKITGSDQATVDLLLGVAFNDSSYAVRAEAVDAIKEMSGTRGSVALQRIAARHPDPRLRSEARDALDERGIRR